MSTSGYTTAQIIQWPPSNWPNVLPQLLAYFNTQIGEGVNNIPVVADITDRDALTTMVEGSLVFVTDTGTGDAGIFVYDGSAWQSVWDAGASVGPPPGGYVAQVFTIAAPATSVTVHAAYGGDQPEAFPGPFTNPDVPRVLSVAFGATWDGGDVEVTGTDQYDNPVTEMFVANPGGATTGTRIFKTVTAATHSMVGVDAETATIDVGNSFGVVIADRTENDPNNFDVSQGLIYPGARGTFGSTFALDTTEGSVQPSMLPNGVDGYFFTLNVTTI